jgi:C1q domain
MKKFLLICLLASATILSNAQSVSINTDGSTAAPSAMLDVKSTNKGMLIPRMASAQRTAIPMPANGLLVYDTDLNKFYYYNGTEWTTFLSGSSSFTLPYSQFLNTSNILFEINNQGTGSAIAATSIGGNAISAYSSNGLGISSQSVNQAAVFASSEKNAAIKAIIDYTDPTNIYPTITSQNNAQGVGLRASSLNNDGVQAYAGTSRSAVRAENTGAGTGVYAKSATGHALIVDGKLLITGGNTNPSEGAVLTSDATGGAVWKSNKIAFHAKRISPDFPTVPWQAFSKIIFGQLNYDYGNNFLAPDGSFTAPVDGIYHFDVQIAVTVNSNISLRNTVKIMMLRAGFETPLAFRSSTENVQSFFGTNYPQPYTSISIEQRLLPGDKIWIEVSAYNDYDKTATLVSDDCFFNGRLVIAN